MFPICNVLEFEFCEICVCYVSQFVSKFLILMDTKLGILWDCLGLSWCKESSCDGAMANRAGSVSRAASVC